VFQQFRTVGGLAAEADVAVGADEDQRRVVSVQLLMQSAFLVEPGGDSMGDWCLGGLAFVQDDVGSQYLGIGFVGVCGDL
jgi:hypothetical protein